MESIRLTDEEKALNLVGTLAIAEQNTHEHWLLPVWRFAQVLRRAVASEQANAKLVERIGQLAADNRVWRDRLRNAGPMCAQLEKNNALLRDDLRHAQGERDKLAAELEEQEAEIRGLVATLRKTWSRFFPKGHQGLKESPIGTLKDVKCDPLNGLKATVSPGPKTYSVASWAPGNPQSYTPPFTPPRKS